MTSWQGAIAMAAALGACSGQTGTLSVSLTTAPGSDLISRLQRLDLTLTNPFQQTSATRTASGFDLAFELPATAGLGSLQVDGFDAAGTLLAVGASPPFPLGGINGHVIIYVATPDTFGAAAATLDPPRSSVGVSTLGYGALFAGGLLGTGAPSDAIAIYNAFDHTLAAGLPLPAPRAGIAVATGNNNIVYLFGGRDTTAMATATAWRFDTNVAPSGGYADFGDKPGFARADQVLVPIGNEHFLASGAPPAELSGLDGSLVAKTGVAELGSSGANLIASDNLASAVFAGPSGVVRARGTVFTPIDLPAFARAGVEVIALPGGKVALACGGPDLAVVDAATLAVTMPVPNTEVPDVIGCAATATSRHLVIAGGTLGDGSVSPSAYLYQLPDLTPLGTIPLVVPRTGATAVALPNDQILVVGGVDANGAPIATIELFTPTNAPVH